MQRSLAILTEISVRNTDLSLRIKDAGIHGTEDFQHSGSFVPCAEYRQMSKNDDSSSDDGGDYTTTNVMLGYAANDSAGDDISHIGGYPVSLYEAL